MSKIVLAVLGLAVGSAVPLLGAHAQGTTPTTKAEKEVNEAWAKIKGAWNQSQGEVKVQWGKLTDNDVLEIDGRRDILVGKIQTRYGVSREEAERQVGGFEGKRR